MKHSGYDMFNINDAFYKDICTPFDSLNDTDILLVDRIDYIYYNEDIQCQSHCIFVNYSMEFKYLICSCSINEEVNYGHKKTEQFNPKKIYESFYDVLKYSNYEIMKCYKIVLHIDVITKNLGSIIVILFFSIYLICLFIFIYRGIIPIKIKFRNNLLREQKYYNLYFKFNISKLLYPPIKNKFNPKIIQNRIIRPRNKIILNKNISKLNINSNDKMEFENKIFSRYNSKSTVFIKFPIKNSVDIKENIINKYNINKSIINNHDIKLEENQHKREYSDYELNELEYYKALKLDKRTLCQTYYAQLKREHLIFFTFINCDDYNLLSVKVSRCIFLIVGDMALNAFFFSDDSMHKLYLTYGKYDFIQQIPQIAISIIISQIIEIFICFLSLTDKDIYQVKKNIIKKNIRNIKNSIKNIRLKIVIYFIFIFIFLSIYWYIISVFCGIYRNTQIVFIKDSFISFSIGLIYPFGLYFISSCLRICSLSNKHFKCIYKLSYMIPFF